MVIRTNPPRHSPGTYFRRTICLKVGMAGIMIEDQVAPKRCGHTKGKTVVGREEAYSRVRAACDAR